MVLLPPEGNLIGDEFFEKRAGPKGGGRIVVVGNSELKRDRSTFVDNANCVMRFSRLLHYDTGWSGTKTDILALRACRAFIRVPTDPPDASPNVYDPTMMEDWLKHIKNFKPWHDCEEMWIGGSFMKYELDVEPYTTYFPEMMKKQVRIVHINPLFQHIFGLHKKGPLLPLTNGTVMVLHLLTIRYLRPWKIQLIGFKDFKQNNNDDVRNEIHESHNVDMDKEVLRKLAESGYISLCD